jgi:hypothetical protein
MRAGRAACPSHAGVVHMKSSCFAAGLALGVLALSALAPQASRAAVVGFEGLPSAECGVISSPFASDGMNFSAIYTMCINSATPTSNGLRFSANETQTLGLTATAQNVPALFMSRQSGAAFDLVSIDLAELFKNSDFAASFNAETVTVSGTTASSGTVTQTFVLDSFSDGPGGNADFQTFAFDSSFTDLLSVSFSAADNDNANPYYLIDNIVYADTVVEPTVSEPGMAAVLGFGLAALGFARRRRAA